LLCVVRQKTLVRTSFKTLCRDMDMVDGILICLPSLLRLVIGPLEYDMTTCAREYGSRMNPLSSKKPQWCNPGIFAPAAFRGTVEGERRDEDAGQPHETVCHCQGYRTRDLTYDTLVSPPLSFVRPRQSSTCDFGEDSAVMETANTGFSSVSRPSGSARSASKRQPSLAR